MAFREQCIEWLRSSESPRLHGSLDDIVALQVRCFPDELITMERTTDLWVRRNSQPAA
jgi:hypothetical protein